MTTQSTDVKQLLAVLTAIDQPTEAKVPLVIAAWQTRNQGSWPRSREVYQKLSTFFVDRGEPRMAHDVADEGLKIFEGDFHLRHTQALAMARMGVTNKAQTLLKKLKEDIETSLDAKAQGKASEEETVDARTIEETLGKFARTYKDLWQQKSDQREKAQYLDEAANLYSEAYNRTDRYWTGINAAAMNLIQGNYEKAREIASRVKDQCQNLKNKPEEDTYWLRATLGEAELLLAILDESSCEPEKWSESKHWYCEARSLAHGEWANIDSSRRQLRLILKHGAKKDDKYISDWVNEVLPLPPVVMFVGHMIDTEKRIEKHGVRFPRELEEQVKEAIQKELADLNAYFGYGSCACGADILFHEILQDKHKGQSHIVLPYERDDFITVSVKIVAPLSNKCGWDERCNTILDNAAEVILSSTHKLEEGAQSYDYANMLLHGLAKMKADELATDLVGLAVWNGETGDGAGGTSCNIERWSCAGDVKIRAINIEALRNENRHEIFPAIRPSMTGSEKPRTTKDGIQTQIMGILFADAVNFSKLTETQLPAFANLIWGGIADLIKSSEFRPVMKNTWGDALYCVFNNVKSAGMFALQMRECIKKIKADDKQNQPDEMKRLPDSLNFRIALHAGPVYSSKEPIIENINYFGGHVTRAARIEPKTDSGEIFTSLEFAALLAVDKIEGAVCQYVGQIDLSKDDKKKYGVYPIYHLKPLNE
jgi:class 3 adenylate cyclase